MTHFVGGKISHPTLEGWALYSEWWAICPLPIPRTALVNYKKTNHIKSEPHYIMPNVSLLVLVPYTNLQLREWLITTGN